MGQQFGFASRRLWLLARIGASFIGGLAACYIGSRVSTSSPDGDLRYGAAASGSLLGWILIPLLIIAIGQVISGCGARWFGVLAVRSLFILVFATGLLAVMPLYLLLTAKGHPAGPAIFLGVVWQVWLSFLEPKMRKVYANGVLFPKPFWN